MLKIKNSYNVIGVMSGTSLDGVDICFCNFSFENDEWKFLIHNTETVSYEKNWVSKLSNAHCIDQSELKKLDIEYTYYLSSIILKFIPFKLSEIWIAICSTIVLNISSTESLYVSINGKILFLTHSIPKDFG